MQDGHIKAIRIAPSRQSLLDWFQTLPPDPGGQQRRDYLPRAAKIRGLRRYFHIRMVRDIDALRGCLESFPCHAGIRELPPPWEPGLPGNASRGRLGVPRTLAGPGRPLMPTTPAGTRA